MKLNETNLDSCHDEALILIRQAGFNPIPALPSDIQQLQSVIGYKLPSSISKWLASCNGCASGPGGLFGIRPDDTRLDILSKYRLYPTWRNKGWIPVAGDGCGNYYVATPDPPLDAPMFFVDTAIDCEKLDYVVASDVRAFAFFLLDRESGHEGWPFGREWVLRIDSGILAASLAPLPWKVDEQS